MLPVLRCAAPAEREHPVNDFSESGLRSIAKNREIRNESGVPEEDRNRTVRANREHVPLKRAAIVLPHVEIRVRDGKQPVDSAPGASGVKQREDGGTGNGKN